MCMMPLQCPHEYWWIEYTYILQNRVWSQKPTSSHGCYSYTSSLCFTWSQFNLQTHPHSRPASLMSIPCVGSIPDTSTCHTACLSSLPDMYSHMSYSLPWQRPIVSAGLPETCNATRVGPSRSRGPACPHTHMLSPGGPALATQCVLSSVRSSA